MIETRGLAREAIDSSCCTMKVLPPPLLAMMSTLASLNDGSNGENGISWRYGVSSRNSGDLRRALPWSFDRKKVGRIGRQHVLLALVAVCHSRQAS